MARNIGKEIVSKQKRTEIMAAVKRKNTKPEVRLRSLLHCAGFRFRLHYNKLPGSPDIVLPKYRVAIFVHGCFWHRHEGCIKTTTPTQNAEFWSDKFCKNVERDKRKADALQSLGWRVLTVWECEILERPELTLQTVKGYLECA